MSSIISLSLPIFWSWIFRVAGDILLSVGSCLNFQSWLFWPALLLPLVSDKVVSKLDPIFDDECGKGLSIINV